MMDMKTTDAFFRLMQEHIALYSEMKKTEIKKMRNISENHFEALDDYVKKEEAFILKAKGFELSRDRFLKENGFENQKMKEIIAALPEEKRTEGEQIYKQLSGLVFDIKHINERCASMSELRLHRIEWATKRLQKSSSMGDSYDDGAKQKKIHSSVISKKI